MSNSPDLVSIAIWWRDLREGMDLDEPNEYHNWYQGGPPVPSIRDFIHRFDRETKEAVLYTVFSRSFCYDTEADGRETLEVRIIAERYVFLDQPNGATNRPNPDQPPGNPRD